jgi:hypothetical protein
MEQNASLLQEELAIALKDGFTSERVNAALGEHIDRSKFTAIKAVDFAKAKTLQPATK